MARVLSKFPNFWFGYIAVARFSAYLQVVPRYITRSRVAGVTWQSCMQIAYTLRSCCNLCRLAQITGSRISKRDILNQKYIIFTNYLIFSQNLLFLGRPQSRKHICESENLFSSEMEKNYWLATLLPQLFKFSLLLD